MIKLALLGIRCTCIKQAFPSYLNSSFTDIFASERKNQRIHFLTTGRGKKSSLAKVKNTSQHYTSQYPYPNTGHQIYFTVLTGLQYLHITDNNRFTYPILIINPPHRLRERATAHISIT